MTDIIYGVKLPYKTLIIFNSIPKYRWVRIWVRVSVRA